LGSRQKCHSAAAFRIFAQIQNLAVQPEERRLIWRARSCFFGSRAESFSLREIRLDVSLNAFAAPKALETSAD
jgi:hypothetical protein